MIIQDHPRVGPLPTSVISSSNRDPLTPTLPITFFLLVPYKELTSPTSGPLPMRAFHFSSLASAS